MAKVGMTYIGWGGVTADSVGKSFKLAGSDVVLANYEKMMEDIPAKEFKTLYSTKEGRQELFAHAKYKAQELLEDVDVLAVPGNGAMIDPELFNQEKNRFKPENQMYNFSRTIAELALVQVALEKGMPIFGVCGGHQLVAVATGGELSDLTPDQENQQKYGERDVIKFNINSMLAQIIGEKERKYTGMHHQFVSKLGIGLNPAAVAEDNVSNEAAESEFGAPIITTQFHPELDVTNWRIPFAEQEQSLKIFKFLNKAGDIYRQKKTIMDELKQFESDNTASEGVDIAPNLKPSNIIKRNSTDLNIHKKDTASKLVQSSPLFTPMLETTNAQSPAEVLRETPPRLWKKQPDAENIESMVRECVIL